MVRIVVELFLGKEVELEVVYIEWIFEIQVYVLIIIQLNLEKVTCIYVMIVYINVKIGLYYLGSSSVVLGFKCF